MSLLNTHGFSPLVKEICVPLSLLGALCSTRLKASIDLHIAQPSSLTVVSAQSAGACEHCCLGIYWEDLLLTQTLSNPVQCGVKKKWLLNKSLQL